MKISVLLVTCTDKPGLIALISGCISKQEANILQIWQHVDIGTEKFFLRATISGNISSCFIAKLREDLPAGARVFIKPERKTKLLILATKESHCLGEILLKSHSSSLDAQICGVISNHNLLRDITEKFAINYYFICHKNRTQQEHEHQVEKIINKYNPDFIVLAKYMRVLSPKFVSQYQDKIINIHHSFLPAFAGAKPYAQAYERGVKIIGATAHFVTEKLDDGPIIIQNVTPVNHAHSLRHFIQQGQVLEQTTLMQALELILDYRVFISGTKTVVFS